MAYTSPNIPPSGATWANLQAKSLSGHLELQITQFAATGAPVTAPTVAASGVATTGGSLAAGGYLVKFTETNGLGETTASPESAAMTVAAGNIPKVTFPALQTGNTARRVYLTPANGATGTEVLYASGITASTTGLTAPAPTNSFAQAPPTVITTGLTYVDANGNTINAALSAIRSLKDGNFAQAVLNYDTLLSRFLAGEPIPFADVLLKHRVLHTAVATLDTAMNEIGALLESNAGTIGTTATPIGGRKSYRSWP